MVVETNLGKTNRIIYRIFQPASFNPPLVGMVVETCVWLNLPIPCYFQPTPSRDGSWNKGMDDCTILINDFQPTPSRDGSWNVAAPVGKGKLAAFNPPLVGMVVETLEQVKSAIIAYAFNPPLVGMVVETLYFGM